MCVVDNLARLLDRRKSVVIIRWKRVGNELKLFYSRSTTCCINSGYGLSSNSVRDVESCIKGLGGDVQ